MHIKWVSRGDPEGYGIAGREYVRLLRASGVSVTWAPRVDDPDDWRRTVPDSAAVDDPVLAAAAATPDTGTTTTVLHLYPTHLQPLIAAERAAGRRVVGYVTWETDQLPESWSDILNQLDAVAVPCTWNACVLADGGVTVPVHVVPHLPPSVRATPEDRARLMERLPAEVRERIDRGDLVCYSIGTFIRRKGTDAVVHAFATAFAGREDVLLLLKTSAVDYTHWRRGLPLTWHRWRPAPTKSHPSAEAGVRRLLRGRRRAPLVHVIAGTDLSDGEVAALHDLGSVYLALPRSEGWGLGAFEAALHARPLVMTAATGQLDYLDEGLAWRVRSEPAPAEEPGWQIPYRADDTWAEPDVAHAVELLHQVAADPEAARDRARELSVRLAERFSPDEILARLLAVVGGSPSTAPPAP